MPARVAIGAEGNAFRRCVEIGVSKDDERPVAAKLEKLRLAGSAFRDALSGCRAARETDTAGKRMRNDFVANHGPVADDEVECALGKVGLLDDPREGDGAAAVEGAGTQTIGLPAAMHAEMYSAGML
jgi:hypothetical protein